MVGCTDFAWSTAEAVAANTLSTATVPLASAAEVATSSNVAIVPIAVSRLLVVTRVGGGVFGWWHPTGYIRLAAVAATETKWWW